MQYLQKTTQEQNNNSTVTVYPIRERSHIKVSDVSKMTNDSQLKKIWSTKPYQMQKCHFSNKKIANKW